jgi:hypothetical protein
MAQNGFVIDVSTDVAAFMGRLSTVQRDNIPFVTAYALTKTAQEIKEEEISLMARVFDRPTRFTLNALYVKPATKRDLQAVVAFKDGFGSVPAWRYLGPEVEGGPRAKKGFERALERAGLLRAEEFAVPARGFKLDSNGNVPGSAITQMLSGLGANPDPLSNTTARSRKRNRSAANYFVLRGVKGAPDGIYKRSGGRALQAMMIFVHQPHYRKRFPFYDTAKWVMGTQFAKHFRMGMALYGNSMRKAA